MHGERHGKLDDAEEELLVVMVVMDSGGSNDIFEKLCRITTLRLP